MEDLYLVLAKLDPELGTAQPQLVYSILDSFHLESKYAKLQKSFRSKGSPKRFNGAELCQARDISLARTR